MDVEGAEGATRLGASKIIEDSKNLIIMMISKCCVKIVFFNPS